MTLAVGLTFLDAPSSASDDWILRTLADHMRKFGKMYPNAGYGGRFRQWLLNPECKAYNSFGNGSAMRVSSVAWLYNDIDAVRHAARLSAIVTHNHPERIKGAEATASAIFLARTGHSKTEIKEYIEREFWYDLNRTCDEIRPGYFHTETCMETVPEAITAFWRETASKTLFALRCPLAVTATPSPPSPAASLRHSTACRRNCGTSAACD